jgi:hypothetical protein
VQLIQYFAISMVYTVQHVINVVYQTVDRRLLLPLLLLLARDWKYLPGGTKT